MEEKLFVELGAEAMAIVGIIAVLVQQCKRVSYLETLQTKLPVFTIAALALGTGFAYLHGMTNPIMAGVMMGLMASGAYSVAKKGNLPPPPPPE